MVYIPNGLVKDPPKLYSNNKYAANIKLGGQNGFVKHLELLDASTPLVLRQVTPIVASVPTLFKYMEDGPFIFKAVMESFMTNLSGIDFSYTLDTSQAVNGNDGQPLDAPTDAKRTTISPSGTWPEIVGNVFFNFFRTWMGLIKSADTAASSAAGLISPDIELPPHTISSYACDLLLIQYDTTLRPDNIVDGFIITNMFPKTSGNFGLQKEMGTSIRPDRTIDFTGIIQHNNNTRLIARNVASVLNLHRIDPDNAPPVDGNVSQIMENSSLLKEAADTAATWNPVSS